MKQNKTARTGFFSLLFPAKNKELNLLLDILETSRGARMVTDEGDNFVLGNTKFSQLIDVASPKSLTDLIQFFDNNDDIKSQIYSLKKYALKGTNETCTVQKNKNNKTIWYAISAEPITQQKGFIHWRIDDITKDYLEQEKLNNEHDKLIDYTDNAPVGFFSVNQHGKFEFINATFARWLGEEIDTLLSNAHLHDFLVSIPEFAAPYDIKENGGVRQYAELKMKSKNNREFLASITQTVVHHDNGEIRTRAVINDLSAQQAIQQALQISEDRFKQFFEEAPIGIVIIDKDNNIKDLISYYLKWLRKNTQK